MTRLVGTDRRLGRKLVAGALASATLTLGAAGVAGASEPGAIPSPTADQYRCLLGQHLDGVTFQNATTPENLQRLLAAASACGITIPPSLVQEITRRIAAHGDELRSLQSCLAGQHLTSPAPGQAPTPEQIAAYRAALVACGVPLPADARHDAAPETHHATPEHPKPAAVSKAAAKKAAAEAKKAAARARKAAAAAKKAERRAARSARHSTTARG